MNNFIFRVLSRFSRTTPTKQLLKFMLLPDFEKPVYMPVSDARAIVQSASPTPGNTSACTWSLPSSPSKCPVDLSIIVPFYNTERFAKDCIDSVLNQKTGYTYEVILVDDGSPDSCGKIVDSYRDDPRVTVIHQANGGASAARNTGIMHSNGSYLLFVDSDDYIYPSAVQALMDAAYQHSADIVEGSFIKKTNFTEKVFLQHKNAVSTKGLGLSGYPWGKVFRRELFQRICFPVGYWYEDTIFSSLVYPISNTTVTIADIVYRYYINTGGMTWIGKKNPKCLDTYYILETIATAQKELEIKLTPEQQCSFLRQLGPYLFGRIHHLDNQTKRAAFILASNFAETQKLYPEIPVPNFYENQLHLALRKRQYRKWQLASILL